MMGMPITGRHCIRSCIRAWQHLVATLNWCGEKCVTKASQNWKHKVWIVSRYNVSPITMGRTPPRSLVMVKKQAVPKTLTIWSGMWPLTIWKKSWNNWGNPLAKSFGWKQSQRCSKTILEKPFANKWGMCWNVNYN